MSKTAEISDKVDASPVPVRLPEQNYLALLEEQRRGAAYRDTYACARHARAIRLVSALRSYHHHQR